MRKFDYDAMYMKRDVIAFFALRGMTATEDSFKKLYGSEDLVSLLQIERFLLRDFPVEVSYEILEKIEDKCAGFLTVEQTVERLREAGFDFPERGTHD